MEGVQSMQPYFEHSVSMMSSQDSYVAEHEIISISQELLPEVTAPTDANRALYNALLQRYKEVGVAGGVGTSPVSIVDHANVPGTPE